jgi:hypothetical protein
MRTASGHVVDGQIRLEPDQEELPEGAAVILYFPGEEDSVEIDDETKQMLLESIAQCERGETIPFDQLMEELQRRE